MLYLLITENVLGKERFETIEEFFVVEVSVSPTPMLLQLKERHELLVGVHAVGSVDFIGARANIKY